MRTFRFLRYTKTKEAIFLLLGNRLVSADDQAAMSMAMLIRLKLKLLNGYRAVKHLKRRAFDGMLIFSKVKEYRVLRPFLQLWLFRLLAAKVQFRHPKKMKKI